MKTQTRPWLLPSARTAGKLFVTGSTVGPIVDSLHNQCLLQYNVAPITLEWPNAFVDKVITPANNPFIFGEYMFTSSWTVPILLSVAYVVLGAILPRLFQKGIDVISYRLLGEEKITTAFPTLNPVENTSTSELRTKAILAVASSGVIIKFSEFLVLNPSFSDPLLSGFTSVLEQQHLILLFAAATAQWVVLDGTVAALLAAWITSIGGPLSELPFVGADIWTYLPEVSDKVPLANIHDVGIILDKILESTLRANYQDLALSSISAPCYFAVTMDAIALGRWFDASSTSGATDE